LVEHLRHSHPVVQPAKHCRLCHLELLTVAQNLRRTINRILIRLFGYVFT
jgi:hypothetical protein